MSAMLKVDTLGSIDPATVVVSFEHDYRLLLGFEYSL